jgi:fumarate reductase subunit C
MFYATRQGLSAADILSRTRGSLIWASFYGAFVIAAAIHAAIGVRTILVEWLSLRDPTVRILFSIFGVALLALGARAVFAVVFA